MTRLRLLVRGALVLGTLTLVPGCASAPPGPPEAGEVRGVLPALSGQRVMLLPIQRNAGIGGDIDGELLFALQQRVSAVDWVGPVELQRAVAQSPVMDIPLDRLPIDAFFVSEVDRVGDPVYGVLRRTAALGDSDFALIPLALTSTVPSVDLAGEEEFVEGISLLSTLLDVRSGRVLWLGSVGREGPVDSPGTLVGVMEELARSLQPAGGGRNR